MRRIGIIGAMEVEIELLKDMVEIKEEIVYAGVRYYTGKYKNLPIVLCSSGVGKVNAASCTQALIDKFQVTHIINTGIAGGLGKGIKVGDTVISTAVTYHDVRKEQMLELFPFVPEFKADEALIKVAVKAYEKEKFQGITHHQGRIVTGECFVDSNELKNSIIEKYNPLCVEMEGGAIGHVAHNNDIPFLIIRSISDNADDEARDIYDDFEAMASNNSARIVVNMLNIMAPRNIIKVSEDIRLRLYDGKADFAFEWYQDEEMVKLVDGPEAKVYDKEKLYRMYNYLNNKGELYFIEAKKDSKFKPIGDVTLCEDDMPIVIGDKEYRGKGLGEKVIRALVKRGQELGYETIKVKEIYFYNKPSQKCFEKVGFKKAEITETGFSYVL